MIYNTEEWTEFRIELTQRLRDANIQYVWHKAEAVITIPNPQDRVALELMFHISGPNTFPTIGRPVDEDEKV